MKNLFSSISNVAWRDKFYSTNFQLLYNGVSNHLKFFWGHCGRIEVLKWKWRAKQKELRYNSTMLLGLWRIVRNQFSFGIRKDSNVAIHAMLKVIKIFPYTPKILIAQTDRENAFNRIEVFIWIILSRYALFFIIQWSCDWSFLWRPTKDSTRSVVVRSGSVSIHWTYPWQNQLQAHFMVLWWWQLNRKGRPCLCFYFKKSLYWRTFIYTDDFDAEITRSICTGVERSHMVKRVCRTISTKQTRKRFSSWKTCETLKVLESDSDFRKSVSVGKVLWNW